MIDGPVVLHFALLLSSQAAVLSLSSADTERWRVAAVHLCFLLMHERCAREEIHADIHSHPATQHSFSLSLSRHSMCAWVFARCIHTHLPSLADARPACERERCSDAAHSARAHQSRSTKRWKGARDPSSFRSLRAVSCVCMCRLC